MSTRTKFIGVLPQDFLQILACKTRSLKHSVHFWTYTYFARNTPLFLQAYYYKHNRIFCLNTRKKIEMSKGIFWKSLGRSCLVLVLPMPVRGAYVGSCAHAASLLWFIGVQRHKICLMFRIIILKKNKPAKVICRSQARKKARVFSHDREWVESVCLFSPPNKKVFHDFFFK